MIPELYSLDPTHAMNRPRHAPILAARARPADRGFTLIEIMVVVVILGILAALVAPNVIRRVDDARVTKARQDIRAYETALNLYRMDNFRYPTTEQGLQALVQRPTRAPGTRGEFDLYTLGADGQPDGEGPDADIGNWNID